MPVSFTKGGKTSNSVADMVSQFKKNMGEEIASYGGKLINSDRVPTGLFPLDLALGGGFPRGSASTIFGPESSNKTNIALRAIAMHQAIWPDQTCLFFDIENSFDPEWAKQLGVDTEKIAIVKPAYGEQMVDMVEGVLHADDCGLVVIDSLAAVVSTMEANSSAEKALPGGAALLTGKLVRKTTMAFQEAAKQGRRPTLLYINQTRYKVGVMFGDPETTPGGNAPLFQSNVRLRVYGKNEMDNKISTVMPVKKKVSFVIRKWKCPILYTSGQFEMVTIPHDGFKVGQCNDFSTISEYLKAYGLFEKGEKGGWNILGQPYKTISEFRDKVYADDSFGAKVRNSIVDVMVKSGVLMTSDPSKGAAD